MKEVESVCGLIHLPTANTEENLKITKFVVENGQITLEYYQRLNLETQAQSVPHALTNWLNLSEASVGLQQVKISQLHCSLQGVVARFFRRFLCTYLETFWGQSRNEAILYKIVCRIVINFILDKLNGQLKPDKKSK